MPKNNHNTHNFKNFCRPMSKKKSIDKFCFANFSQYDHIYAYNLQYKHTSINIGNQQCVYIGLPVNKRTVKPKYFESIKYLENVACYVLVNGNSQMQI